MTRILPTLLIGWLVTGFGLAVPEDKQFEKIFDEYFKVHTSLAGDSTEGINGASQAIDQLATSLRTDNSKIQGLASSVSKAAQEIQGKDLEAARLSFFEMSKPLLLYLNQFYQGEKEYYRYFCSMAKKGWIQPKKGTKNPYYGSSMLTCGDLIQ